MSTINGWTILLFGASGDLSMRKIIPSVYALIKKCEKMPNFTLIGAAYDDVTSDEIIDRALEVIDTVDESVVKMLRDRFHYVRMNFEDAEAFSDLASQVNEYEMRYGLSGKRLIYLSVPANYFCTITEGIGKFVIAKRSVDHPIVYEKPFGWDLASAQEINACISRFFDQRQIYRIDHYLSKEFINNILFLRFTNIIFDPLWHHEFIDCIEIICNEKEDIEGRGAFYDEYGALKDMVQSHMLQMLALVAMERPKTIEPSDLTERKNDILEALVFDDGMYAQYEGYREVSEVAADSSTETFVAVRLRINHERWCNVTFILKTGKCLHEKESKIRIWFRPVGEPLVKEHAAYEPNVLTILISPEMGFDLQLNSKRPLKLHEVMPVELSFCHDCLFAPYTPRAYESLLEAVMRGERTVSVSEKEIESQWRITERMLNQNWSRDITYPCGSAGPDTTKLYKGTACK